MGHAEIQDFHQTVGADENVRRLDVPVDDSVLVGEMQTLARLDGDVQELSVGPALVGLHHGLQVGPVEQLHDNVRRLLLLAQLEDGDDVGVPQAAGRLGLGVETLAELRVRHQLRRHGLDGDLALEGGVEGDVDHAHRSLPEGSLDLVLAQ